MSNGNGSANVVVVNPFHPRLGLIFPFVAQRVLDGTKDITLDQTAKSALRGLLGAVVAGGDGVLLLAMVAVDGSVVGHSLAVIYPTDPSTCYLLQCRADENVGDAVMKAVEKVDEWAKARGAERVQIAARNEAAWKKRGFKTVRSVMELAIDPHESQAPQVGSPGAA